MRSIGFILTLLPFSLLAQRVVLPLSSVAYPQPLISSAQGMAVYKNHAVLLRHGGQCAIVDLKQRKCIATYQLDANTTHCNNASFSSYIPQGDKYPLLYISGCFGDKACYTTRITDTGSVLLHRIYFDHPSFAQDWCVDAQSGSIYAYLGCKGGPMYLKQFRLPAPTDTDIHLTEADVISTTSVNCVSVAQGSKIHQGYAYLPDGDEPGQYYLHIVELGTGREVRRIDLNPIGLEPEGVEIVGRWIYVSFNSPDHSDNCIYRFRR